MSVRPRGLGKGLDLLLGSSGNSTANEQQEIQEIPLTDIFPNPSQPRQEFPEAGLDELATSIRSQGVLQPILVRPRPKKQHGYEIVAGERRWRASQRANQKTIPALIRDIDDKEILVIALIENLQREDLNPIEEAVALSRIKQELNLRQEELAKRVGRSRSAIANSIRLLNLPESIKQDLAAKTITPGHARAYLALNGQHARETAHARVVANHLSVRQAEELVRKMNSAPAQENSASQSGQANNKHFCRECRVAIQNALGQRKGLSLRVSGGPDKGSITLSYTNAQELKRLLRIMEQGAGQEETWNKSARPGCLTD